MPSTSESTKLAYDQLIKKTIARLAKCRIIFIRHMIQRCFERLCHINVGSHHFYYSPYSSLVALRDYKQFMMTNNVF